MCDCILIGWSVGTSFDVNSQHLPLASWDSRDPVPTSHDFEQSKRAQTRRAPHINPATAA
jgi:hypothetical protein